MALCSKRSFIQHLFLDADFLIKYTAVPELNEPSCSCAQSLLLSHKWSAARPATAPIPGLHSQQTECKRPLNCFSNQLLLSSSESYFGGNIDANRNLSHFSHTPVHINFWRSSLNIRHFEKYLSMGQLKKQPHISALAGVHTALTMRTVNLWGVVPWKHRHIFVLHHLHMPSRVCIKYYIIFKLYLVCLHYYTGKPVITDLATSSRPMVNTRMQKKKKGIW